MYHLSGDEPHAPPERGVQQWRHALLSFRHRLDCGVASPLFGVCCILAFIVMYDAMGVRRETGDQGKVINDILRIFEDMGKPISPEKKFKELVGHTPLQVVCGAALGIAVGCALMQL